MRRRDFVAGFAGAVAWPIAVGNSPAALESQSRALQFLPVRVSIPIARCRQGAHYSPLRRQRFLPVGRGERRPTFERKPLSEVVPVRAQPKEPAQHAAQGTASGLGRVAMAIFRSGTDDRSFCSSRDRDDQR